jgi:hypothetical protein
MPKPYNFPTHTINGDWKLPVILSAAQQLLSGSWTEDDRVDVGLTPDHGGWDDYGFHQNNGSRPLWSDSSDSGSGVVTLVDPASVNIVVPAYVFDRLGPGTINVGVRYINKVTNASASLLVGRLPLQNGWV